MLLNRGTISLNKKVSKKIVRSVSSKSQEGSKQWSVGRLLSTAQFFDVLPNPIKMIQATFMGTDIVVETETGIVQMSGQREAGQPVVLVTGATGALGRIVVEQLMQKGKNVRALVRDVQKAKDVLGSMKGTGCLEVVVADLTQKQTLVPSYFTDVRYVIGCHAAVVRPKEADSQEDLDQKYKQGIKFYDSSVVGDTPETVEFGGMKNLLSVVNSSIGLSAGHLVLDPSNSETIKRWGALDDVVMGGVSESSMVIEVGQSEKGGPGAVFRGLVTTANNGGFASVRTKNFEPCLDLGAYEGLELRVKGNGLRYKCIVRTDTAWDGVGFNRQGGVEKFGGWLLW